MPTSSDADTFVGKVRVIDGDTLDVGSVRVRLHGIDAPEHDQPCETEQGAAFACGAWVTDEVTKRYQGQTVECTAVTKDRYARTVARCTFRGEDIGRSLVSDGLAYAFRRYSMDYDLEEKQAFVMDRGLHGLVLQRPGQHRSAPPRARLPVSAECRIKGNISGNGQIYHMPGQKHYDKVVISPAKGERLFCSEAEAQRAGWRRARR